MGVQNKVTNKKEKPKLLVVFLALLAFLQGDQLQLLVLLEVSLEQLQLLVLLEVSVEQLQLLVLLEPLPACIDIVDC